MPRPTKNPRKAHGDGTTPMTLAGGIKGKKRAAAEAAAEGGGAAEEEEEEEKEEEEEEEEAIGASSSSSSSAEPRVSLLDFFKPTPGYKGPPKSELTMLSRPAVEEFKKNAGEVLAELETKSESQEEGMIVPHNVFSKVLQVLTDIKTF